MRRLLPRSIVTLAMLTSTLLLVLLAALYYFAGTGDALQCYVCTAPDPVACPRQMSAAIKGKDCPGTDNVCLRVDVILKASGAAAAVRECLPAELGAEAAHAMYSDAHVLVERVHTCSSDLCNGAGAFSHAAPFALALACGLAAALLTAA